MQVAPFQLHRFSPYYFDAPRYGIQDVRPAWGYRFAYPGLTADELAHVAYCFEFSGPATESSRLALDPLFAAAGKWMSAGTRHANLSLLQTGDSALVYDSRKESAVRMEPLTSFERRVLDHLSQSHGRMQVLKHFAGDPIEAALQRFREEDWIVEMDGQVLSVVLDYSWAGASREAATPSSTWM
jgi:hypothetical protein